MNKKILTSSIVLVAIIFGLIVWGSNDKSIGATYTVSATNSTTSTPTVLPTLVLDSDSGRKKISICNDSATKIYLYKGNFSDASAASTTVILSTGYTLAANTCVIESQETGIWYGQIWATSTASGLDISTIEEK